MKRFCKEFEETYEEGIKEMKMKQLLAMFVSTNKMEMQLAEMTDTLDIDQGNIKRITSLWQK